MVLGESTYVVLLTQLLAERGAHDDTALARAGLEVSTAALASGGRNVCFYLWLVPIFNQLVGDTAKLTLVQLDHFGGWIFGRRGNPVVWRWVMRREREKKIQHKSRGQKIGCQIGGRNFSGLWSCT